MSAGHHNLAIVLQRGRHEQALVEFDAASRIDPRTARRLLAGMTGRSASTGDARTLDRAAWSAREVDAHLQLAAVCQRLDDRICRLNAYRHVTDWRPTMRNTRAARVGAARGVGVGTRLRERHPKSARVQQALGREYSAGVAPTRRSMHFSAHSPTIQRSLISTWQSRIHLDAGRVDDASREIDRELAIVPFGKDALELKAKRMERSAQPPARSADPLQRQPRSRRPA
jgi:hypothetical protein